MPDPILSAILIVGDQRERPAHALASILSQSIIDKMEVLIFDLTLDDVPPLPGSDHPSVRVIRVGPGGTAGKVRAESVRQARAPIVAFLEEHAWAFPGWAEGIVKAHQEPWAAVGVEFHVGNTGLGLADAASLSYYPLWSPPAVGGESESLPSHDTTYKRDILLSYGDQLEMLIFPEVLLHWKLRQDGYILWIDPDIKIKHYYETELGVILRGCFIAGRVFIVHRPLIFHWPWWKRIARFVISPLLPFRRLWQIYQIVRTKRPDRLAMFWRSIFALLLFFGAGVAGEMVGTLFGKGNSDVLYLRNQISDYRDMPAGEPV